MTSFWRFTLFGIFGAAGIGLALCVALSGQSAAETTVDIAVPSGDSKSAANDTRPDFTFAAPNVSDARAEPASQPVRENVHPPIAHQQSIAAQQQPFAGQQPSRYAMPPQLVPPPQPYGRPNLPPNAYLAQAPAPGDLSIESTNPAAPAGPPRNEAELMEQLRKQLQRSMESGDPGTGNSAGQSRSANGRPEAVGTPPKARQSIKRIPGEGDNNLSINIQDADLRDVLGMLSEQGGLNILPSPNVQGKVSASLSGVDIDTALAAILRSTGYIAKHDGKFIYVGSPQDFKAMDQTLDTVGTRIYHLNYVRAADVQALVTSLLTPGIGTISVTAPANEGIAADSDKVGGNQFAGGDSVLIHDFVAVLDQIEQVIGEIDRHPAQVQIEAMILRVKLKDEYRFGIDFELLRQNPDVRLATGSPLASVNDLDFKDGGLKVAFLNGSTNAFIQALETIGDTNIVASPRLMVVDKARAEVLIGRQLGYVNTTITETSTAQNVQFLEVGTQLRLRPFISSDGMVRMEVHPELSEGNVEVRGGFTLPNKETTQVTTNVVVPDGCTVIIGGLIQDGLKTDGSQVPFFGSLPGIGWLFRNRHETTEREEIVVLITPHIVCGPEACCEGDKAAAEFHRRHAVYADSMSPLGKRYIGRKYYRLAQASWAQGDQPAALRFADLSVHFDPESRAAINLRTDIWNGNLTGDHTLLKSDVVMPAGYNNPVLPDQIEPEYRSPGYDQPLDEVLPQRSVMPKSTRAPANKGQRAHASDTPPTAPALLPANLQANAMQLNAIPASGPGTYSAVVQAAHEVEVGPRLSGYSADTVKLPSAPSAALPMISTKPLDRMSTAPQVGLPPLRANAANFPDPNGSPAPLGSATRPLGPSSFPNSKSVMLKKPAVLPPPTNPTGVQPAAKNSSPGSSQPVKVDVGLDNQQLPDWMLNGLMQSRSAAPEKLPTGPSRALEPTQK
jgi:type II secretory pathway component GspD/PulD (secretin)